MSKGLFQFVRFIFFLTLSIIMFSSIAFLIYAVTKIVFTILNAIFGFMGFPVF